MASKLSVIGAITIAVILVVGTTGAVMAGSQKPIGKWMENSHGPGTPSPFPCTGDGGAEGHEFYWDANGNGEHDHIPGTFQSVPSEPVGCFTDDQLKGHDKDEE